MSTAPKGPLNKITTGSVIAEEGFTPFYGTTSLWKSAHYYQGTTVVLLSQGPKAKGAPVQEVRTASGAERRRYPKGPVQYFAGAVESARKALGINKIRGYCPSRALGAPGPTHLLFILFTVHRRTNSHYQTGR